MFCNTKKHGNINMYEALELGLNFERSTFAANF